MCSLLHELYVGDAAQIHNYQIIKHILTMYSESSRRTDSGDIFPLDPTSAHSVHT